MILSISEQAELFFCVFAAGCAAGVFYDIIEVFRMNFPHKKTLVCIEDLIYWMSVIILLFLFMLEKNYAEIRFFNKPDCHKNSYDIFRRGKGAH